MAASPKWLADLKEGTSTFRCMRSGKEGLSRQHSSSRYFALSLYFGASLVTSFKECFVRDMFQW